MNTRLVISRHFHVTELAKAASGQIILITFLSQSFLIFQKSTNNDQLIARNLNTVTIYMLWNLVLATHLLPVDLPNQYLLEEYSVDVTHATLVGILNFIFEV